jgi:hypothetical protein
MNHSEAIQSIWVNPPRFTEPIVNEWRKLQRCHCCHCGQLESWLEAYDSVRLISLHHVDALLTLVHCGRDDCMDWLQLLLKRSIRAIEQAEVPIRSRWLLEQEHTRVRNWLDDQRLQLWFFNSLATTIGAYWAEKAIKCWMGAFDLSAYLDAFDDFGGLPFNQPMRCRVSLAASDFYLEHHSEIAAWGRD